MNGKHLNKYSSALHAWWKPQSGWWTQVESGFKFSALTSSAPQLHHLQASLSHGLAGSGDPISSLNSEVLNSTWQPLSLRSCGFSQHCLPSCQTHSVGWCRVECFLHATGLQVEPVKFLGGPDQGKVGEWQHGIHNVYSTSSARPA